MMTLAAILLGLRIVIHHVLERWFCVRSIRKEHDNNSLEYSYFYHLSIVILLLSDVKWNLFDLNMWIISYICIGMIRRGIYVVNIEREIILNDYSYNNNINVLLSSSKIYGIMLFVASIIYYIWINYVFLGVQTKVTSLLCFPVLMLALDSLFMFLNSFMISKNILCFYNSNINQIPPTYKFEIWHKISSSSLKIWHFYNLFVIFAKTIYEKL